MKRIAIGVVVFGAALAALRRFGPALRAQVMQKCEGMFARMPEEFSPVADDARH